MSRQRLQIIKRRADWEQRLFQFTEARARVKFSWGKNDCALFVADAVREMTGHDFAAPWRGQYSTETGAHKQGCLTTLVKRTGLEAINNKQIRRGDVAYLKHGKAITLGVCVGEMIACMGDEGVEYVCRTLAISGWRVG